MGRDYQFHREHAGCSVTAVVHLGTVRELELLVNGKPVGFERLHGHHAGARTLTTVLPTDPPVGIDVRLELPGAMRGDPVCVLTDGDRQWPMPLRPVPRTARPTEASWYS
ncbi:hypothetical protein AB0D08_02725 [Kitasatospora sp. NPDC048540]|uniref:hypothetical protein n=1 Tax=Kitasatospora sp. NPDC048540 TaxID=3155634 RepID=UPI0033C2CB15